MVHAEHPQATACKKPSPAALQTLETPKPSGHPDGCDRFLSSAASFSGVHRHCRPAAGAVLSVPGLAEGQTMRKPEASFYTVRRRTGSALHAFATKHAKFVGVKSCQ